MENRKIFTHDEVALLLVRAMGHEDENLKVDVKWNINPDMTVDNVEVNITHPQS